MIVRAYLFSLAILLDVFVQMEKMKQDFDATQKELNAAKDKIDLYRRVCDIFKGFLSVHRS